MELIITDKAKRNAKLTRMLHEKKWRWIRISLIASLIATLISAYLAFFVYPDYMQGPGLAFLGLFCFLVMVSITFIAMLISFTSQHITDRMGQRIWVDGDTLNHFMRTNYAGGANTWETDESGFLFVMDIKSIHNARFDPQSKRVEFLVSGKGYRYKDYDAGKIEKEWALNDMPAVFYDYTTPSLVEVLESKGVNFKRETINFKMRNTGI